MTFGAHTMRIGLDGYPLSEPRTGVGHYTLELARALAVTHPADEFELVSPKPFAGFDTEAEPLSNLSFVRAKSSSIRGTGGPLACRCMRGALRSISFMGQILSCPCGAAARPS